VGTGGALTGAGRRLKEHDPRIKIVSIVPEVFPGIEGLKPLGRPEDNRAGHPRSDADRRARAGHVR